MVTPPQRGSDRYITLGKVISTLHIVIAQYPTNYGVYTCTGSNSQLNSTANVIVQVTGKVI